MRVAALLALLMVPPGLARAADVTVMISGGFLSSLQALAPGFERDTGDPVTVVPGPSMGTTVNAIPQRLARGEPDDVLIMVGYALDGLLKDGRAVAGSKVDLALSPIGMAVRAGRPVPDISTEDKLRAVLLAAKSVAYSDSASGVYIERELFRKLGIEEQMHGKAHMIPATPVGEIVAKGEAELGFQQKAELLPVAGITFAGLLPASVQSVTVYSAGIATEAKQPEEGAAADPLLGFRRSGARAGPHGPATAEAVTGRGLARAWFPAARPIAAGRPPHPPPPAPGKAPDVPKRSATAPANAVLSDAAPATPSPTAPMDRLKRPVCREMSATTRGSSTPTTAALMPSSDWIATTGAGEAHAANRTARSGTTAKPRQQQRPPAPLLRQPADQRGKPRDQQLRHDQAGRDHQLAHAADLAGDLHRRQREHGGVGQREPGDADREQQQPPVGQRA